MTLVLRIVGVAFDFDIGREVIHNIYVESPFRHEKP